MVKKKLKRKPKKLLIILILILSCGLIVGGIYLSIIKKPQVKETKVVSKISKYGYNLKSNKSAEYKKLFQKLKKVLTGDEIDEKEYVKTITEMFIVDFYSLNDHSAKTDVGGTDFIYPEILENFLENAEDTIYKYVESNIYKQRKQKLPKVDVVTINKIENEEFAYGDKIDENAYKIEVSWTYKDETIADGYQNEATLIFIHNGIKLELVELQ